MKKQIKKGFTLVELLVVIAILAVLATVSVVGYTSFITKANNSNALTELKQAEEVVLAELIDTTGGAETAKGVGDVKFEYKTGTGRIEFSGTDANFNTKIKSVFKDLNELNGTFSISGDVINYETENKKGHAYWQSGQLPKAGEYSSSEE